MFAGNDELLESNRRASRLESVVLQLSWTHEFQFAGYYMAKEKGYYREAGFDVKFRERSNSMGSVEAVVLGRADFGISQGQLYGQPIVVLASILQNSPAVIVALESANIQKLEDLMGKRVMNGTEEIAYEYRAMLAARGVAYNQIELVPHTGTIDGFVEGHVDACMAYLTDEPYELQRLEIPFTIFRPEDYGVDSLSEILFTSQRKVVSQPARVKAFRDASLRGWRYAMAHVDETIDLILSIYTPDADREKLAYEAAIMRSLMQDDLIEIGYVNPARWKRMMERLGSMSGDRVGRMTESEIEDMLFDEGAAEPLRRWLRNVAVSLVVVLCLLLFLAGVSSSLRHSVKQRTQTLTIVNERLREKQTRLEEAGLLLRLERDFAISAIQTNTLKDCLNQVVDLILQIPCLDCSGVYIVNEGTGVFQLCAYRGVSEGFANRYRTYDTDLLNVADFRAGQKVSYDSEGLPPSFRSSMEQEGLLSILFVPIVHEFKIVAVLHVASRQVAKIPANVQLSLESLAFRLGSVIVRFYAYEQCAESEALVLKIAEGEKQRIGQDLHDAIGQELVGITCLLKSLENSLVTAGSAQAPTAKRAHDLCQLAHQGLRKIVRGLLALGQDELLSDALKRLCGDVRARSGISCEINDSFEPFELDSIRATNLYHVASEAVANGVRHGNAQRIVITLAQEGETGVLSIADDGCGFDPEAVSNNGSGLSIMRYRANVLGGSISILSRVGNGTTVRCTFPLQST